MILHIKSDASYLSGSRSHRRTGGHYYLISLPTDLEKDPNLPPPSNEPIHMECRIFKQVVVSAAKVEVRRMFYNAQKAAPISITIHELGFPQPQTPIKTDNSAAEVIVTAIVRQKSTKAMDMRFYWMKDRF